MVEHSCRRSSADGSRRGSPARTAAGPTGLLVLCLALSIFAAACGLSGRGDEGGAPQLGSQTQDPTTATDSASTGQPNDSASGEVSGAEQPPTQTETETETESQGEGRRIETMGDFLVFRAEPEQIELVWRGDDGKPLGQLEKARRHIESQSKRVLLILNSGLYQPGLVPAGLHVEDSIELTPLNLNEGAGNFHLMPNGVFSISEDGAAVQESNAYAASGTAPRLAVQSGPMLTIDGEIHPKFGPNSESRFVRNGVGVTGDGQVVFIQSTRPVTLWAFAEAFLDNNAADSLYLDGSIARMEAPVDGRSIFFNIPFAGMLAVTEPR